MFGHWTDCTGRLRDPTVIRLTPAASMPRSIWSLAMSSSPGTVSKILWHFTGGPKWDEANLCQLKSRKSSRAAYSALVAILTSKELRIGQYKEVIKVPIERPATASKGKTQASEHLVLEIRARSMLGGYPDNTFRLPRESIRQNSHRISSTRRHTARLQSRFLPI